jgi:hypothetical protein
MSHLWLQAPLLAAPANADRTGLFAKEAVFPATSQQYILRLLVLTLIK